MARSTVPVFSTTAFSYTHSGTAKTGEVIEINDHLPTAKHNCSLCITATLSSTTDSCVVYARLGYGTPTNRMWGPWHTVEDTAGNTTFSLSTTEAAFEANLYAQDWWTLADAIQFRMGAFADTTKTATGDAAFLTT